MNKLKRNDGINNNTYNLLFSDFDHLKEKDQGSYENAKAFYTIDLFTKLQEHSIFTKLLKIFLKNNFFDLNKITYNNQTKQYEYKDNDLLITFDKLSKCFDDSVTKELTSRKRYHKCHDKSIILSMTIENSKIVTGYITIDNEKVLHSIIEYCKNDEIIIFDWTRNLQIPKDQYIKLTKFQELASCNGEQVIEDMAIIAGNLNLSGKTYTIFRDEIMKDIQRNAHLFKTTELGQQLIQSLQNKRKEQNNINATINNTKSR